MLLVFISSCINPLIYTITYGEFQNGVRRMMARVARNPNQIQSLQSNRSGQAMPNTTNQPVPDTGVT